MALTVNHAKHDNIPNATQAQLNAQIALGNFPVGTVLNDIVLPSDWNANLVVTGSASIAQGGTNNTSFITNGIAYYDGTKLTTNTNLEFTDSAFTVYGLVCNSFNQVGTSNNILDDGAGGAVFSSGNIQIGSFNNGGASLYVDGSLAGDGIFLFDGGGEYSKWTQSGGVVFIGGGGGVAGTQMSMFGSSGNVSIGASQVDWGTGLGVDGTFSCVSGKLVVNSSAIVSTYGNVATAGIGTTPVRAAANITAKIAASTITSYTLPATDGDYNVSAQMSVTAATAISTSINVTYTDVTNTVRTMIIPIASLAGNFLTGGLITTTGVFESTVMHIRAKASSTITIATAIGTFNTVTYSASAAIKQLT